jgi:hypothetical protein
MEVKNMNNKKLWFISIILILLFISCSESDNPLVISKPIIHFPVSQVSYLPGEVEVEFQDSVDHEFISSFINKYKLTPIDIYADSVFSMWIQVDSGDVNYYINRLQQDTAVSWAKQRGYSQGDPKKSYILAYFKGTVKINYALSLIHSINGLSWMETFISTRSALIGVPIGEEQYWISFFVKFSFVKSAGLNYMPILVDLIHSARNEL